MVNLEFIQDYIRGLSYKDTLRILAIYCISFTLLVGFLLYRHVHTMREAQQKTKILNKTRQDIQAILTEYNHIKSKKNDVDILLAKDKSFYLKKYYQDTMSKLSITNQSSANLVDGVGPAGYQEEILQITFTKITMKQLCEFLQALQDTPRVFVKNLDITKGNLEKKINVNVSIATYKPVVEKISSTK